MTQATAQRMAEDALKEWGLWAKGWRFAWMGIKRKWGRCHHVCKLVMLSRHFVGQANEGMVHIIILHEIAHALAGPTAHHGRAWIAKCAIVGIKPRKRYYGPSYGYLSMCELQAIAHPQGGEAAAKGDMR